MTPIEDVLSTIDANLEAALNRLTDLLAIPSVSTDRTFAEACERAAQWLSAELTGLGFAASVRPTAGHPVVVAHRKSARPGVPHVLFYGHYDVQPVDPLALWATDPFKASRVATDAGEQIVARGASDDKGQLMTFLEACRAFAENGGLPCDVTILLEGEEETGSPSLPDFVAQNRAELKADLALICDTAMWDAGTPAITTMLRGLVLDEVVITGANRDLHSGLFGGAAVNPIHVLGRIMADLHGGDGRVSLPGFYDEVEELPQPVYNLWKALPFDPAAFLGEVGLSVTVGEADRMLLERIWSRPTCDVNGITGGYQGQGSKAVVPCQASAKFSFRLVGAQNPATIRDAFRSFVRARLPSDCTVEFIPHGAFAAVQLPVASDSLDRARWALSQEWDNQPVLVGSGGAIPIADALNRDLGMDLLMIGFSLNNDRQHAPNEKYNVTSFHKGARSWARILNALSS